MTTPPPEPTLVLKLQRGWTFDPDGPALHRRGQRVQFVLPPGTRLVPALALPPAGGVARGAAEREIGRYLHLRLGAGADAEATLELVRGWDFVERAAWLATP